MSRAVVLAHRGVAHELGALGDWLDDRGFSVTRIHREDQPTIPDADLLIALGSPDSVATGRCLPPAQREIAQVTQWLTSDRPYLGICFGSQVLSLALGGAVNQLPATNRGWVSLDEMSDLDQDLAGPWMVWHEDAITAPATATLRGRYRGTEQVFSQGRAWGIQFHPELRSDSLERMGTALGAPRADFDFIVSAMAEDEDNHRSRCTRLFDAFWLDASD